MKSKQIKTSKKLEQIGLWATWWWGVSCVYVLLLAWLGRDTYAVLSASSSSKGFFGNWQSAFNIEYDNHSYLAALLAVIVIGWIIGGVLWLQELKSAKISYKAAFKDLFLTIRK